MTKKNIRPQQVAPVERETISTAKDQSGQVEAQRGKSYDQDLGELEYGEYRGSRGRGEVRFNPFAGDDAE